MNIYSILLFIVSFCYANTDARPNEIMLATYIYTYDPQAASILVEGAKENSLYPKPQFKESPSAQDILDFLRYFSYVMTQPQSEHNVDWTKKLSKRKVIINRQINVNKALEILTENSGYFSSRVEIIKDEEENSKRYKSIILGAEQINDVATTDNYYLPKSGLSESFKGLIQERGQATLDNRVNLPESGFAIYEYDDNNQLKRVDDSKVNEIRESYENYINQFSNNKFDVDTYVNNYNENKNVLKYYIKDNGKGKSGEFMMETNNPKEMNHVYIINRLTHIVNKCN